MPLILARSVFNLHANRFLFSLQGRLPRPQFEQRGISYSGMAALASASPDSPDASDFKKDNDQYSHVNNAVYYEYMDTIINHWLIKRGGLRIGGDVQALIVSSSCDFKASVKYPEVVTVGLRVAKLGRSSLSWQIGIFSEEGSLAALGKMVHVFVSAKAGNRPVSFPSDMRSKLELLVGRPNLNLSGSRRAVAANLASSL